MNEYALPWPWVEKEGRKMLGARVKCVQSANLGGGVWSSVCCHVSRDARFCIVVQPVAGPGDSIELKRSIFFFLLMMFLIRTKL